MVRMISPKPLLENCIGHKCNIEQYRMLMRCSEKKDITEWNAWRKQSIREEIWLQGACFNNCYLEKAELNFAHCEGASFVDARCERTQFGETHCEKANFIDAHCEGATFVNAYLTAALFLCTHLKGAIFDSAYCEQANFYMARCEETLFVEAHCEEADFRGAHCEGAKFCSAHCDGANFAIAYLQQANFSNAHLSNKTTLTTRSVDDGTDFSNASLSSVIIEPGTRAFLERNIRRKSWEKWYGTTWFRKMTDAPIKWFWYLSEYGYSTKRVLYWLLVLTFTFALIYTLRPGLLELRNGPLDVRLCDSLTWLSYKIEDITPFSWLSGQIWDIAHFGQMFAFAASTMVTLGFSNINVATTHGPNMAGMIIVTLNLMTGYFMLAVLVTRLAILFQTLGPGMIPAEVRPAEEKRPKTKDGQG